MLQYYERPKSIHAAIEILTSGGWTILAGGTDIYPTMTDAFAWGRPQPNRILDISAVETLLGVEEQDDCFRIGGRVTWTDLIEHNLPSYSNTAAIQ